MLRTILVVRKHEEGCTSRQKLNLWTRLIWLKINTVTFEHGSDKLWSYELIYLSCHTGSFQRFFFMTGVSWHILFVLLLFTRVFEQGYFAFIHVFLRVFFLLWWTTVLEIERSIFKYELWSTERVANTKSKIT